MMEVGLYLSSAPRHEVLGHALAEGVRVDKAQRLKRLLRQDRVPTHALIQRTRVILPPALARQRHEALGLWGLGRGVVLWVDEGGGHVHEAAAAWPSVRQRLHTTDKNRQGETVRSTNKGQPNLMYPSMCMYGRALCVCECVYVCSVSL